MSHEYCPECGTFIGDGDYSSCPECGANWSGDDEDDNTDDE